MNEWFVTVEIRVTANTPDEAMDEAQAAIEQLCQDGAPLQWLMNVRYIKKEDEE